MCAPIPQAYKPTEEMLNKSVQAGSFYDQTNLSESFLGKIANKEFQSYESKNDKGDHPALAHHEILRLRTCLHQSFGRRLRTGGFKKGHLKFC